MISDRCQIGAYFFMHKTQCVLCKNIDYARTTRIQVNIFVVLIGLVVVFKSQAAALVSKIWKAITEGSDSITG